MKALVPLLLAPLLMGQAKPKLVPDVSETDIEIVYSFTGAELLLFGAIIYPGGRPAGDKPVDIVVVVKGPTQSVLVREKEKVAGIWVNADRLRYRSAPSFYAVASSRPVEQLVDARTRAIYELGFDSLQLSPASSAPATRRYSTPPRALPADAAARPGSGTFPNHPSGEISGLPIAGHLEAHFARPRL